MEEIIEPDFRIVIIPWAFIYVDNGYIETEAYFPKYGPRYEREMTYLRELGLQDDNVYIADCYADTPMRIKSKIEKSDIVILTGGNPITLKDKICSLNIDTTLRNYENIIIGGSAGATTQFEKYFITEEQNYSREFQEYKGLGILHADYMIDVHTDVYTTGEYEKNKDKYYSVLQKLTKRYEKKILGICDTGALLVDRKNQTYEAYGNIIEFNT
jgi:peptidase E